MTIFILCITIIIIGVLIALFTNDGDSASNIIESYFDGRKKVVEAESKKDVDRLKQEAINKQIVNDFLGTKIQ